MPPGPSTLGGRIRPRPRLPWHQQLWRPAGQKRLRGDFQAALKAMEGPGNGDVFGELRGGASLWVVGLQPVEYSNGYIFFRGL